MREVISINIGQAGVQLGAVCWQLYCIEHGLDYCGYLKEKPPASCGDADIIGAVNALQEGFHSFFMELPKGNFTPRALFVDLEPTVIDQISFGPYKALFNPKYLITGKEDAANNYARGYYSPGLEMQENVSEPIRKTVESCDGLQGFIFFHSFGGGTGSGLHAGLLERICEDYTRKKSKLETAIFPSMKLSTSVVEPYNAVLTTHATMEISDCVFLADNEAMYDICHARLSIDSPTYNNLNRILAQTVSSITASLRFKGTLNADFIDFQTNLVPYPRIHFPLVSYAPIVGDNKANHETMSVADMTRTCFSPANRFVKYNPDIGKYVSICLLYRGDVAPKDINAAITALREKRQLKFVDWSPTGFKLGINNSSPAVLPGDDSAAILKAVCMICNTTAIKEIWANLNVKYNLMLRKKAFFHWFTGEGLTESEFYEAQDNLLTLEQEYDRLEQLSL
uniref:Tubulin alpha chain n=1 Tax=Panstrongylus lignarius TaxID=156445 RepID=A0A224XGB3_9HEMI